MAKICKGCSKLKTKIVTDNKGKSAMMNVCNLTGIVVTFNFPKKCNNKSK